MQKKIGLNDTPPAFDSQPWMGSLIISCSILQFFVSNGKRWKTITSNCGFCGLPKIDHELSALTSDLWAGWQSHLVHIFLKCMTIGHNNL